MTPEIIARINELAKKQRECGLNHQECAEQAKLRRIYIDNIKNQLRINLDCVKIVPESSPN
ncbi:DUF896 domain-containing protein [Dendrosporobacter sp. 1207_IL3150]|uniref:DUF896 domain-containing protein n=1 Tax=Dendrosporobacter sp. 1207_IL3150 TaxID=3084054 RepID=UPI002FD96AED